MTKEEEEVLAAARRFYDAIEAIVSGRGVEPMKAAWHHTPRATASHPLGTWSRGWDEILPTWEVFAGLGRPEGAGSSIKDLRAQVYGDVAYTTCTFTASPAFGGGSMNCTNIFHHDGGVWKVIHHHADRTPSLEAAAEKMSAE